MDTYPKSDTLNINFDESLENYRKLRIGGEIKRILDNAKRICYKMPRQKNVTCHVGTKRIPRELPLPGDSLGLMSLSFVIKMLSRKK